MSAQIRIRTWRGILARGLLAFALAVQPLTASHSQARTNLEPRLQIGIGLLPAVMAANQALAAGGSVAGVAVYLVYQNDWHVAEQLRAHLEHVGTIRQSPVVPVVLTLDELLDENPAPHSAVFIAEPLDSRLDELIEFTAGRRQLLFSPFKGDVERGVTAGFRVTDKVLPHVNLAALKRSNIQLRAFFLRIAVKHE